MKLSISLQTKGTQRAIYNHRNSSLNCNQKPKAFRKQAIPTTSSPSSGYRSKLLITQKQEQVVRWFFFVVFFFFICLFLGFFFYLWLLRHARSPTMPGTPVSPLRSTATVMNYANPLVFVQSTMTQGCKQLTPGIKKSKPLPQLKGDNNFCCTAWQVALKCNRCNCLGDIQRRGNETRSSSRGLPTAIVMPHVEWSRLKRRSQADHTQWHGHQQRERDTHTRTRTHTYTHTHSLQLDRH